MSHLEVWGEMETEVVKLMRNLYDKLQSDWEELYGANSEHVHDRSRKFFDKLKEYCSSLEQESEVEKHTMIANIEDLLRDNNKLSKELHIECDLDFGEKTPLAEVYHKLFSTVSNLKKVKRERLAEYKTLKDKENDLCSILSISPLKSVNGIASEKQMKALEGHIQDLEAKRIHQESEILNLRSKISSLLYDLGVTPLLTIEKFCVNGNESLLAYNKDTFSELEKLLEKMESQRLGAIEEAEQLRSKLSVLWERVGVTYDMREAVLRRCKGHSKAEIVKLKEEVNRCEELKRKNLKVYIDKVKDEILNWWDRCCMSDHQKTSFRPFYETHHTEDLLTLLELELERSREFYTRYEIVFQLAEKRQAMWEKFRQLEASTKDTNRLFNNRGGALLREEKERKKIQKDLPKVEDKLKQQLTVFEEKENRPFLIYGENLREEMERHWEEWHFKRDIEKNARKVANVKALVMESKLGTQQLQIQQQQGKKRKMATPLARNNVSSKVCKVTSDTSVHTYAVGSSEGLSSCGTERSAMSTKIASARRVPMSRENRPQPYHHPTAASTPSDVSVASTYSLFQEHLEDLSKVSNTPCRSTLTTGQRALRPRNAQTPYHSSPKTPKHTPYSRTMTKTPHKSPFKVGAAPTSSRIPTMRVPAKSPRPFAQLKTPRRNLPIII